MKGPSLQGGRGVRGQPLLLRCLYCGEDWPDTAEFFRYWHGRRIGRKCLACTEETRTITRSKPQPCARCLVIRTTNRECHGCAGRLDGPLTPARLASLGLAARV